MAKLQKKASKSQTVTYCCRWFYTDCNKQIGFWGNLGDRKYGKWGTIGFHGPFYQLENVASCV
tara:strand:+ start:1371 stop:1559 length:189 start_codon:yes stop_codon:yes gene_type:complete